MRTQAGTDTDTLLQNDPRIKLISARIKKEKFRPDALIEILHTAQNAYGYLPLPVMKYITRALHLPPSRVYSTATFYHFFSLKSKGDHTCLVCTGTACYVKGAQSILNSLEQHFGFKAGEVSADHKVGIQVARCIGACGLAPVAVVDDEVLGKTNDKNIIDALDTKLAAL